MEIKKRERTALDRAQYEKELRDILKVGPLVNPVCDPNCERYKDQACRKDCEDAKIRLTSDANYPLEDRITPLVFEIKRLGVFEPCWSCEGHSKPDGSIWKIPRVWFYAQSVSHIRALYEVLAELHDSGKIKARWEIVVTYSAGDTADTCFSLQPNVMSLDLGLSQLQQDVDSLAEHIGNMMPLTAHKMINRL